MIKVTSHTLAVSISPPHNTSQFSLASLNTANSPDQHSSEEPSHRQIAIFDNILNNIIYSNVLTSSIYSRLGGIECTGIDGNLGLPIAATVIGTLNGDYVDFGGTSLCNQSCSGTCVKYPNSPPAVAPPSLYPFGCDCAVDGCNENGPIPPQKFLPGTMVTCRIHDGCTCGGLSNPADTYVGYICNWLNVANGQHIYLHYDEQYSPIRWCDCCPDNGVDRRI
ncbi:hypothetical protein Fcan01_01388 [Folsomia candida]|uniref:Uncharacterized protein n=1 Tax=Folsomia candida TaxID=158441 RepID=A0A226EWX8_FOLCA|nr:hypothetical protein Fcan01_01388 [Folsomia candida]